ncbi:hypothetical protein [Halanaerobaculum tunisiense]
MEGLIISQKITVKIPTEDVKQELGYQEQTESSPKIESMIVNTIDYARPLLEPRGKYIILEKIEINQAKVNLAQGKLTFQSQDIADLLANQEAVALLAVTIGDKIEKKVEQLFAQGQLTKATTLDAIGSVAVEEAANQLTHKIKQEALARDLPYLTMRYSPGYGDSTLDIQPQLLNLLAGANLGITTNQSFLLQPQKSITALIGLGVEETEQAGCDFDCRNCELESCIYNN